MSLVKADTFETPPKLTDFNTKQIGGPFWGYAGATNSPNENVNWSGLILRGFNGNNSAQVVFGGDKAFFRPEIGGAWSDNWIELITTENADTLDRFSPHVSRSAFIRWAGNASPSVGDTQVVRSLYPECMLAFHYTGASGHFNESNLDGWEPLPINNRVSLAHYGDNVTHGVTDMYTPVSLWLSGCVTNGWVAEGNGPDVPVGLSRTIYVEGTESSFEIDNFNPVAIGTWGNLDGYTAPLMKFTNTHGPILSNVKVDCKFKSSGVLFENTEGTRLSGAFLVQRWDIRSDDRSYGVRTKTKAGGLVTEAGATARQFLWADTGRDDQSQRTGYGFKIETADCYFNQLYSYYTKYPFHKSGFGQWQMDSPHVFNGAMNTITDKSKIYGIYIEDPANGQINGVYSDNCTLYLNSDDLHNSNTTFTLNGGNAHSNGADDNDYDIRVHTTVANNTLSGLSMSDYNLLGTDGIILSTSGRGSFAADLDVSLTNVATRNGSACTAFGVTHTFGKDLKHYAGSGEGYTYSPDGTLVCWKVVTPDTTTAAYQKFDYPVLPKPFLRTSSSTYAMASTHLMNTAPNPALLDVRLTALASSWGMRLGSTAAASSGNAGKLLLKAEGRWR